MELPWPRTLEEFNQYCKAYLFVYIDILFTKVEEDEVIAQIPLQQHHFGWHGTCLLYTSPSPRDGLLARMPSSA